MKYFVLFFGMLLILSGLLVHNTSGQVGPGGVTSNLVVWLRADTDVYSDRSGASIGTTAAVDGDSVRSWGDQTSARTNDATTMSGIMPPIYHNNSTYNINFNPVIRTGADSSGLDFYDDFIYARNNGLELIVVLKPNSGTTETRNFAVDAGEYASWGYGLAYSTTSQRFYAYYSGSGISSTDAFSADANPAFVRNWVDFTTSVVNFRWFKNGNYNMSKSGSLAELYTTQVHYSATHQSTTGPFTIGRQAKNTLLLASGDKKTFQGSIAEVIMYDAKLSSTAIDQVETYLALKYGIKMSGNYIASDGSTVLWDATKHSEYSNYIAGIGRADDSGLNQKQSMSTTSSIALAIGLSEVAASNSANSNSFSSDDSYMLFGSSTGSTSFTNSFEGESNTRMGRVWRVEETGTVGTVEVRLPNTAATLTGDQSLFLITSTDSSDFTLNEDTVRLTDDGAYFRGTFDFDDDTYFTFMKGTYVTYCSSGGTETSSNGTLEDGSGALDYVNNTSCDWLITVTGANNITIDFDSFVTAGSGDVLKIYDGTDAGATLLGSYYGDLTASLPSETSSGSSLFITFETDGSGVEEGWSANWYSEFYTGGDTYTTKTGSFTDGSGDEDYGNNSSADWTISVAKADSIVLSFSAFDIESTNDVVTIYDGTSDSDPVLATLSGSSLPSDVVSTGGNMYIVFTSNGSVSGAGFSANYTSGRSPGTDFTGLTSTTISSRGYDIEACEYFFGGSDQDRLFDVFQNSHGDLYFVGDTKSWGTGMEDLVVMKTDSALNEKWTKTYGSSDDDYLPGAAMTSDDKLLIASRTDGFSATSHDGLCLKLDTAGTIVGDGYRITDSGPYQEHNGVMIDDDGNYYFLGGNSTNHKMEMNVTVVDTSMTRLWYMNLGTQDSLNDDTNDIAYAAVQYDDTTIFVVGYVREPWAQQGDFDIGVASIDIEDEVLNFIKIYNEGTHKTTEASRATDVIRTSDDKILVAGYTYTWGVGANSTSDGFLMKVEPSDGSVIWMKTFGGSTNENFIHVLETPDGNYMAVGYSNDATLGNGGYDGLVVKTDTAGTEVWSKTYGGSADDVLRNALILNDSTYLFVGESKSQGAGHYDFWIVKTDEYGSMGNDVTQTGLFTVASETPNLEVNTTNATGSSTWTALTPTEDTGSPSFLGCTTPDPYPGGVSASLAMWLNASDSVYTDNSGTVIGSTLATDGDDVNAWRNIYHYTSTDATTYNSGLDAPVYHDNSTYNLNYNPVVRFDGYDDALDFYDDYIFSSNGGMELIAVVDADASSTGQIDFIIDIGGYASIGYGMGYSADGSVFYALGSGSDNRVVNAHASNDLPLIQRGSIVFNPGGSFTEYWNGASQNTASTTLTQITAAEVDESASPTSGTGPLSIGRQSKDYYMLSEGRAFMGNIGEVIVYNDSVSDDDMNKVESYLAIKYGITKSGNYVNNKGDIVWDATANSDYHNNVIGIGRDNFSGLMQKQSRSINTDAFITVGLGDIAATNSANTATFDSDRSFMVLGYKGTDNDFDVDGVGGEFQKKINKEWLIKETGSVGTVEIGVDTAGIDLFGCERLYMVIDSDNSSDFTTADDRVVMILDGTMFTCQYDFSDDDLISFVKYEDAVYLELPAGNTVVQADEHCELGELDHTYFYDLNDPEKLRFAIEKNPVGVGANTSAFEATVTITTHGDPTTAQGVIAREDDLNQEAAFYLGRYWNVDLVSGSLNGWVNIRFYFDAQDTVVTKNAAGDFNETYSNALPMSNLIWFKSVGEAFDTTKLTAMGYSGNQIQLNDYVYGVEDGITYVEFKEVSSFSGGGGMFGVGDGVLPVILVSFAAEQAEGQVNLMWTTSSEKNTEKFIIQRSTDLQNWRDVGEKAAFGFSDIQRDYRHVDASPALGLNYYRLKIVDFDGYTEFSENRFVMFEMEDLEIQLYPNPARDEFHVKVPVKDVWFELFNTLGRMETIELELRDGVYNFSTHHLAKGMYFLQVHTPGREETVKVVLE